MPCEISSGRVVDCKDQIGGISKVFISETFTSLPNQTDWAETADVVSAVAPSDASADLTFFQFDVRPETSSMTVTYASDPANGTTFFEQALSLTFQRLESTDIADIRLLCQGRPNIWVMDNNSNLWLLGAEFGCNVTGGNLVTGTSFADLTGYTIDFSGREPNPVFIANPPIASGDALSGVQGAVIGA